MAPTQLEEKDSDRIDSYRVATAPFVPDDGRGYDGRPKSRRHRTTSTSKSNKSLSAITEEIEVLKAQVDVDEHMIPLDELYSRYATDPNMGLTEPRVKEVQDVYGPNSIILPTTTPEWVRLAKNLFGGFSFILWIGCCLSLVTFSIQTDIMSRPPYENLILGIMLGFVAIVTGLFSFYQEVKAERMIESFRTIAPQYCLVIREGRKQLIPTEEVTMGDVIEIKAGERIPADIRIISSLNFKVDQSGMSGELEPQLKSAEFSNNNPLETLNLAFCGTYATEGFCKGIVIRTGDMTVPASLSHLTVTLQESDILLTDEVTWWMQFFMSLAICLAVSMFIFAFTFGFHWLDAIIFLVGVIVAIVPEGLVAVVTICLTLTAKRLYNKNCLMKSLSCVEKIGAVSVILTDRTGVLTQNMPLVSHLWIDGDIINVDGSGNETLHGNPTFRMLQRAAVLCNHAEIVDEDDNREIGDPNEVALLRYMGNASEIRHRYRKVCEIPFNRIGKFHVTIHENAPGDPGFFMVMKGSPEEVIQRCSTIFQGGKEWHLDDKTRDHFTQAFVSMANSGEKVISFCDYKLPPQKFPPGYPFDSDEVNFPMSNLRFLGLISLTDPLRPTVPDAIRKCRSAGVRVIMVTGDHPITAQATAKAAGLFTDESQTVEDIAIARNVSVESINPTEATAAIVHGAELKTMTPDRLNYILSTYRDVIFARTSLQQKLYIVEGLQRLGCVVSTTGLGVPDVPAVKKANLGIALSESNVSVVKEAADLILLDNNFATIVTAIEEGRLLFVNLRKSISYIVASNMPEFMAYVLFLILGVPLPLGTITILVIDMGTDMIPAISLAYEAPEEDLMQKNPPNDFEEHLIDIRLIDVMDGQIGMIQALAGFFTYFVVLGEHGFWFRNLINIRRRWNALAYNDFEDSYGQEWTLEQRKYLEWTAHSAFFITIVMCQWITLIVCKTRHLSLFQQGFWNHYLNFALIFETGLAMLLVYTPGMDKAFRLMPVRINWWITGLIFCLMIFVYDECRRFVIRRNPRGWTKKNFY